MSGDSQVVPPEVLEELRPFRQVYAVSQTAALKAAIKFGQALLKAKRTLPHGAFLRLFPEMKIGIRLGQDLMALAREAEMVDQILQEIIQGVYNNHVTAPSMLKMIKTAKGKRKSTRKRWRTVSLDHIPDFELEAEVLRRQQRRQSARNGG